MSAPTPLSAGAYKQGDVIGLGKTASEYYPYCVIKVKTWICSAYQTQDSKGNTINMLTVPFTGEADFFWPQWHAAVDYTNKSTKPWVPWKVCYNGFYYEPSIWLTSAQTGKNPSVAEANVGDRIGEDYQLQLDPQKPQVCRNQSHPIRAWTLLGSLEENNGWNGVFTEYFNPDPITGEVRKAYLPYSFIEDVGDFKKIGGDADGDYAETYYPRLFSPQLYEADSSRKPGPFEEQGSTYLKQKGYDSTTGATAPVGWNAVTGEMPKDDIISMSPYSFTFWFGNGAVTPMGVSANLWQQKTVWRRSYKKHVEALDNGGNSVTFRQLTSDTVTNSPMPEDKTMIIDWSPGPSIGSPPGYWYVYIESKNDASYVPSGSNGSTRTENFNIFFMTPHPAMWTRKFNYWIWNHKVVYSYKKAIIPGSSPPSYNTVLNDVIYTVDYQKRSFTPSFNQWHVFGADKQGGLYTSKSENIVGTFQNRFYYNSTEFSSVQEQTSLRYSYANWDPD